MRQVHTRTAFVAIAALSVAFVTVVVVLGLASGGLEAAPRKGAPRDAASEKAQSIDTSGVWRSESAVFTEEQLAQLEPILRKSRCQNVKDGCAYQTDGRPATRDGFAFRLIPWPVSPRHKSYLVRPDRCGAGGCDEGLVARVDGRWRLLTEAFGVLAREKSSTLGFSDLTFRPRGQGSIRLVWDGAAYREAR